MIDSVRSTEINNNIICEAMGCYYKATNKITLSIGYRETISLFVCAKCRSKFQNESANSEVLQGKNDATEEAGNA
jgi:transposase-like protein